MEHYEHIDAITDYLLIFTKKHAVNLEPLKKLFVYELELFGTHEYYNGRDVGYDKEKYFFLWSKEFYQKHY